MIIKHATPNFDLNNETHVEFIGRIVNNEGALLGVEKRDFSFARLSLELERDMEHMRKAFSGMVRMRGVIVRRVIVSSQPEDILSERIP